MEGCGSRTYRSASKVVDNNNLGSGLAGGRVFHELGGNELTVDGKVTVSAGHDKGLELLGLDLVEATQTVQGVDDVLDGVVVTDASHEPVPVGAGIGDVLELLGTLEKVLLGDGRLHQLLQSILATILPASSRMSPYRVSRQLDLLGLATKSIKINLSRCRSGNDTSRGGSSQSCGGNRELHLEQEQLTSLQDSIDNEAILEAGHPALFILLVVPGLALPVLPSSSPSRRR